MKIKRLTPLAWLVVMVAVLAALPAPAQAVDRVYAAEREPVPSATETLTQAPSQAAPVEDPPTEPVDPVEPVEPEPVEPVEPVEPEPVQTEPVEPEPVQTEPVEPAEQPAPEPAPAPPTAVNRARTVQVTVQVQVGCRHHCDRTTQSQVAWQEAHTEQTAVAPDGEARNESVTEQYVWQLQIGCFLFCTGTVQTQTVEQRATTTQYAEGASATNSSTLVQRTRQLQVTRPRRDLLAELHAFLRELSLDATVTLQVIRQLQVADCRHHCSGGSQVQLAEQQARTVQQAATASVSRDPPDD